MSTIPETVITQQAYTANNGHGSVGPVIGVLAVIIILGILAGMIGRMCSGKRIMGYGQYDVEGWVETRCSSCIDGRIDPPPPPRQVVETARDRGSTEEVPVAAPPPVEIRREIKEEQQAQQKLNESGHS